MGVSGKDGERQPKMAANRMAKPVSSRATGPCSDSSKEAIAQNPLDHVGVFSSKPVVIKLDEEASIAIAEKLINPAGFNDALKEALRLHSKLVKRK